MRTVPDDRRRSASRPGVHRVRVGDGTAGRRSSAPPATSEPQTRREVREARRGTAPAVPSRPEPQTRREARELARASAGGRRRHGDRAARAHRRANAGHSGGHVTGVTVLPPPQTRREARSQAAASSRQGSTYRVVVPLVATALAAAGVSTTVVGLPAVLTAGTHATQDTASALQRADAAGSAPSSMTALPAGSASLRPVGGTAALIADRSDPVAARGSLGRMTLAWGTAAVNEGQRLMTARVAEMESSLSTGVELTQGAQDQVRNLLAAHVFHEPVLDARQTSGFGWRWGRMHNGLDFGADIGTPLYAVGPGAVTTAGWNSGLGYHVKITLDTGELVVYGHLSRIEVAVDDRVDAGSTVGTVGNTGRSTGAHLHFEVHTQQGPMDPAAWLESRRG